MSEIEERIEREVAAATRVHNLKGTAARLAKVKAEVKLLRHLEEEAEQGQGVQFLHTHLLIAEDQIESAIWAIEKALNPKVGRP